jgi:cation-transporting ATPase 13A1
MESLKENKPLLYSIIFSASAAVLLACRIMPELKEQFQIVDFPADVSINLFYSFAFV